MLALAAFVLASSTFHAGGTLPLTTVYTGCGGANRSPELHWTGAPKRTKSFALIVHDPDAPHQGGWYHWVMYDISAYSRGIAASFNLPRRRYPSDGWGVNDFSDAAYDGPCPPPGKPHHYDFTLYALDVPQIGGAHLTAPQLLAAMRGHILAQTTLTGLYGR